MKEVILMSPMWRDYDGAQSPEPTTETDDDTDETESTTDDD